MRDRRTERDCVQERDRKSERKTGRDSAMESGKVRASLWEKKHQQNFKLCLWHCSHTLTSTVPDWEYLSACQTLLRALVIHF